MSYTIIFNSQSTNVTSLLTQFGSTNSSISYNVNWGAILDPKYKKFNCEFVFKSLTTTTFRTDNAFVSMNLGNTKIFDGQSMTQNIGFVYPVTLSTTQSYYNSTNNDNNNFIVGVPNNNVITINLNSFNNTLTPLGYGYTNGMPHYVLILSMQGIE